jgi:hypothetical protein
LPPLAAYTALFERNGDFVAKFRGDGVLSIPVILKRMMILVQMLRRKITIGRLFSSSHMMGALSRSRIAGGELRLGTRPTYIAMFEPWAAPM